MNARPVTPFIVGLAVSMLLGCRATHEQPTAPTGTPIPEQAPPSMDQIQSSRMLKDASYLASDELGGRLTGSPGQEAAARFVAERFEELGLEPLGDEVDGERSYFQSYGIERTSVAEQTRFTCGSLSTGSGFAVMGARACDVELSGKLRYVGRGRTRGSSAEVQGDEDLSDVLPVVLVRPPRGRFNRQLSMEEKFGMSFQSFASIGRTARNLERLGARAVLFAVMEDNIGFADVLNYLALSPGKDLLSPRFAGADPGMGQMMSMLSANSEVVSLVMTPELSAKVMGVLDIDPVALQEYLAGDGDAPTSDEQPAASLHLVVEQDKEATAKNVVAVLRGKNPDLREQAIVYSAHMDHVGRRVDGEIYNGADDNASGTAGLMAIAQAFARAKERPERSVVFLAVSGEELGLWGSAYYADNPTWTEGPMVANINTDMIGRSGPESGPDEVTVTPSYQHRMFSTVVQEAARLGEVMGIEFISGDKYYQRSDHYNFAKKGIPVVFFCNGEHEDYHQVTDHADKLDAPKMEKLARLAFWTGWQLANDEELPRTLGRRSDWQ